MKQFSIKLAMLTLVTLAICKTARLFMPLFFNLPYMYAKDGLYMERKDEFDVVFLGTSRINRGVDPEIFDKKASDLVNKSFASYNYSNAGNSLGELFYLLDRVIDNKGGNLKYILFEVRSIASTVDSAVCVKNLHTSRNFYWRTLSLSTFSFKSIIQLPTQQYVFFDKIKWGFNTLVSHLENNFNVGMMNEFVGFLSLPEPKPKSKNGHTPYTKDKRDKRKWILKEAEEKVGRRKQASTKLSDSYNNIDAKSTSLFKQLNHYIKHAEKQGIQLILLLPPLVEEESYEELAPVFAEIPSKYKIVISDANRYPDLYKFENVYDGGHVNRKGSKIYTQILAEKFVNRLK